MRLALVLGLGELFRYGDASLLGVYGSLFGVYCPLQVIGLDALKLLRFSYGLVCLDWLYVK